MVLSRSRGRLRTTLRRQSGILLDISRGGTPQQSAVVLSAHHNVLTVPFPLKTGSVHTCVVTHVLEFLSKEPGRTRAEFFQWWDELHRVMRPHGTVYVSGPYGGDESEGWLTDPDHCIRVVEQTFAWLDPRTPLYDLHAARGRKRPKPWHPISINRVPGMNGTISYNAVLQSKPSGQEPIFHET